MNKFTWSASALIILIVALAVLCDVELVRAYKRTDLSDKLRNFQDVPAKNFSHLILAGGNGYAIQLVEADTPGIKLLKSRTSFFSKRYSGDTLYIDFKVANQQYQHPDECVAGLIIYFHGLQSLKLSGVNSRMKNLKEESLKVELNHKAFLRCDSLEVNKTALLACSGSTIVLARNNKLQSLNVKLSGQSTVEIQHLECEQFIQVVDSSSNLVFKGKAATQFLH